MTAISVENQYKKFSDLNKSEVLKLVEWSRHQKHLPDISELEAILFLYSCHNSVEMAKKTFDLNFTMRTLCPEFFAKRDVMDAGVRQAMEVCGIAPLPYTTAGGDKIIMFKFLKTDSDQFHFSDVIKLFFMCFDLWMIEEGTARGFIIVVDITGFALGHVLRISPFGMKKFLYYLQEACPVRLNGFHFINTVPAMDKLMALMKPFIKKDLMEALLLHKTAKTLYPFVSEAYLPEDYGGHKDSFISHCDRFYEKLSGKREYFRNEETRRVNEKLREGNPKNTSDVFGAEGNFKKLDID